MIVYLFVHSNNYNITFGTGRCILPVNLKNKFRLLKFLFKSSYWLFFKNKFWKSNFFVNKILFLRWIKAYLNFHFSKEIVPTKINFLTKYFLKSKFIPLTNCSYHQVGTLTALIKRGEKFILIDFWQSTSTKKYFTLHLNFTFFFKFSITLILTSKIKIKLMEN